MAVAFVRDCDTGADGDLGGAAGARSVALTVPAAGHALGNTLVVCVTHRGSGGTVAIVDDAGNTYTKVKERNNGDLYCSVWVAYLATGLVSGDEVTVTSSSTSALVAGATEYSGVSETDPVDVDASNTGTLTPSCSLATTSGADRVVVAAVAVRENPEDASDLTGAADPNWTGLNAPDWTYTGGGEWTLFRAYRVVAAAAAVSITYSLSGLGATSASYSAVLVALQSAPAGGSPNAPSLLTATVASSTAIDLAWTDNASDETSFRVERSLDGSTWAEIGSNAANDVTYSDTGLTAGTTYYYRVRARNASGDSAYSNTATATTTASGTATVPTAPATLSADAIGSTRIQLDWTDQSTDEDGFKIERSTDGTTFVQVAVAGADITSWVNSGLAPSTLYYYRVRAYNEVGNSGYSNTATATTWDEGTTGSGDCPVERFATVTDVQRLLWSGHLVISDSSEPNRAAVEDWLCDVTQWMERQLAWKYVTPITDTGDREVLRPICAALVAARCWQALVARFSGQEARAAELEGEALSRFVWNPGGIGSRMKGSASVFVGGRTGALGRSLLVLKNTAQTSTEPAGMRKPSHTFSDPNSENGTPRRFSLSKSL